MHGLNFGLHGWQNIGFRLNCMCISVQIFKCFDPSMIVLISTTIIGVHREFIFMYHQVKNRDNWMTVFLPMWVYLLLQFLYPICLVGWYIPLTLISYEILLSEKCCLEFNTGLGIQIENFGLVSSFQLSLFLFLIRHIFTLHVFFSIYQWTFYLKESIMASDRGSI